jgi:5'-deoxynucleotidase YfbR-like HD superfamily hydrolase
MTEATPGVLDEHGLFKDDKGQMTVASGQKVNPLTMVADQVDIIDIATALSRQCRYNGHVGGFYTVARHSLWVADRLRDMEFGPKAQMQGLLHDAAEAYLGDMIRPLKHGELGEGYMVVEARLEEQIAQRFGLVYPWPTYVGIADTWVLMERELGGEQARWTWHSTPEQDFIDFITRYDLLELERNL